MPIPRAERADVGDAGRVASIVVGGIAVVTFLSEVEHAVPTRRGLHTYPIDARQLLVATPSHGARAAERCDRAIVAVAIAGLAVAVAGLAVAVAGLAVAVAGLAVAVAGLLRGG